MAAMVRSLSVLFLTVPNTFFRALPLLLPMAWMGAVSVPSLFARDQLLLQYSSQNGVVVFRYGRGETCRRRGVEAYRRRGVGRGA
jgi:hypothetical protein